LKSILLCALACVLCSCAGGKFRRAPEAFKAPAAELSPEERGKAFQAAKAHAMGPNEGQVGGQSYNGLELLRYYEDSRHSDAAAAASEAVQDLRKSEDWAFYCGAYGSILGILIGGIGDYLNTSNSDMAALNSAGSGALRGWAVGAAAGISLGGASMFYWRHRAQDGQERAAGEFNRTLRIQLKMDPYGAGAELKWEY